MYQTLLELKHKRATLLEQGKQLIAEKKFDEHKQLMDGAVADVNAQIDGVEKQLAEEGRFEDGDGKLKGLHDQLAQQKENAAQIKSLDEVRGENEYARAFIKAMASGATVKNGRSVEAYAPLYKALSITGGEPVGSDGGFLVPVEFDNAIIRLAKEYLDLSALFNVEQVARASGWRAVESGTPTAMPNVDELAAIGKEDQPGFVKVAYNVKKFADRLPISNELLEDESAGLLQYVAEWFAIKYVLTKNSLLLPMLTGLSESVSLTAGSEDTVLRKALITKLNTANSRAATLLTNQSGYAEMDGWLDGQNRPLLVPDPTAAETMRYRNRRVMYGDDSELTEKALYVGNFKQLGTLFMRKGIEMASTNVGGDAWATGSSEIRVICRMDAQQVNGNAAFKATFDEIDG